MKKTAAVIITLVLLIGVFCSTFNLGVSAATSDAVLDSAELPSKYNDINNLQYVTSVKDQEPYGLCWAFSAVACAEADAIKNHGASASEIDLSEWHLAYFSYYGDRTDTGDTITLVGSTPYYNIGGFHMLPALTLSNWIGFVDESIAPYTDLKASSSSTIDHSLMYECDYKIKNVYQYDITTEPDKIK